jgi:flagellar protein FliO/FliZ
MNLATYIQFLLALVFVLALIGTLAWLARRFGFGLPAGAPRRGQRRLQVLETAALDAKRRLVLVRRDEREHLLLIGATSETVIESGIEAPGDQARPSSSAGRPGAASRGRAAAGEAGEAE